MFWTAGVSLVAAAPSMSVEWWLGGCRTVKALARSGIPGPNHRLKLLRRERARAFAIMALYGIVWA